MRWLSQIVLGLARQLQDGNNDFVDAHAAGIVLVLSWSAVLLHAWLRDAPTQRLPLGGVAVLAATAGLGVWLETESSWRLFESAALEAGGMVLVWLGAVLHVRARRALGARWSPRPAPSSDDVLVEEGPYGLVRHPLYAAIALMAIGTTLVHPSLAVLSGMAGMSAGLAIKIRVEERALRTTHGTRWDSYAARVPAVFPWPFRRDTRR